MRIAVGADHGGFPLKAAVVDELRTRGWEVTDFGAHSTESVDFPDYAEIVGSAIRRGEADRGVLLCGSGVGMAIAANKMRGIRASVAHDTYSAHQGVEHDGMNVLCLGARVIGEELAREIAASFAAAEFMQEERFQRRVGKIDALEAEMSEA